MNTPSSVLGLGIHTALFCLPYCVYEPPPLSSLLVNIILTSIGVWLSASKLDEKGAHTPIYRWLSSHEKQKACVVAFAKRVVVHWVYSVPASAFFISLLFLGDGDTPFRVQAVKEITAGLMFAFWMVSLFATWLEIAYTAMKMASSDHVS